MKAKVGISIIILSLFVVGVYASEQIPILVSPGSDVGIAMVGEVCPTFSWTAVDWATAYRVEVFIATESQILPIKEMASQSLPVLIKEIPGAATAWTPSTEEQLSNLGEYVWYVQAIDEFGSAVWSEGKTFTVNLPDAFAPLEEAVSKSLRENGVSQDVIDDVMSDAKSKLGEHAVATGTDNPVPISVQGTEGLYVTKYGYLAGNSTTTTYLYDTFIGSYAGQANTTGTYNTYLGHRAGQNGITGIGNTMLGSYAGYNNTADNNVFTGYYAGYLNTSGWQNVFNGTEAGYSNTYGYQNVFVGAYAGHSNTARSGNTFVGYKAGFNNTDYDNTFIGKFAGYENTTGRYNTFLGMNAGQENITGENNTFLGVMAGYINETGANNCYLGYQAGRNNINGSANVCLGYQAGANESGSDKLYVDNSNTSDPLIWGDFSTDTLALMGTVGVGTKTPSFPMEMKKTGTNASIVLDRTDGATNYINATATSGNFGTVTNHVLRLVVGSQWKMRLHTDNSLTFRNGASCTSGGVWTNASSRDLKDDINDLTTEQAFNALNALQPVTYKYKADIEDEHVGFIAEDVPDLVASKDRKGMSPMDVVAVLTKVLQEQQNINEELRAEIAELRSKLNLDR